MRHCPMVCKKLGWDLSLPEFWHYQNNPCIILPSDLHQFHHPLTVFSLERYSTKSGHTLGTTVTSYFNKPSDLPDKLMKPVLFILNNFPGRKEKHYFLNRPKLPVFIDKVQRLLFPTKVLFLQVWIYLHQAQKTFNTLSFALHRFSEKYIRRATSKIRLTEA